MAKVQIESEKLTPLGGIFSIMKLFNALLAQTIDSTKRLSPSKRIRDVYILTSRIRLPIINFLFVTDSYRLCYICLRCGSSDAPMLTTSTPIMMQSEATASISTHLCMSIFAPMKSSNTHTPVFR